MPHCTDHYRMAFVHRSMAGSVGGKTTDRNNERLEFLGDAIIEAAVSDILYHLYPDANEGVMSRLRSNMVCRARLNSIAFELGLDKHIKTSSRKDIYVSHIPGDALEAFVAAVYLDGGFGRALKFVKKHIASQRRIDEALSDVQAQNFKTDLVSMGEKAGVEIYFDTHRLTAFKDDHKPRFAANVMLYGRSIGQGEGSSKKMAEQNAAGMALKAIEAGDVLLAKPADEKQAPEEVASHTEVTAEPVPNAEVPVAKDEQGQGEVCDNCHPDVNVMEQLGSAAEEALTDSAAAEEETAEPTVTVSEPSNVDVPESSHEMTVESSVATFSEAMSASSDNGTDSAVPEQIPPQKEG